jgi:hypothetical protein
VPRALERRLSSRSNSRARGGGLPLVPSMSDAELEAIVVKDRRARRG